MDDNLNRLIGNWEDITSIILYGAGLETKRSIGKIKSDFCVSCIVDQDDMKWGKTISGIQIKNPQILNDLQKGQKVLITVARRRYKEISSYLIDIGLKENEDFCHISQFAMEWYFKYKGQCCIMTMDMAITTACSLKCRDCNMFIPYYKKPVNYTFEELKRNVDLLFSKIDFVFSIGLLGGEAFLNKNMIPFIKYIHENYSEKYCSLLVTTNGVVPPSVEMMETLKECNVIVTISDYTAAINSKSRVNEIDRRLRENGIESNVRRDLVWCKWGFPTKTPYFSKEDAREHMLRCDPGWRGLNDGKFYFCNCAWSAEKAGLIKLEPNDYLDLRDYKMGDCEAKEKILRYAIGDFEKGYMSFCRYCKGCGSDNIDFVDVGVQVDEFCF